MKLVLFYIFLFVNSITFSQKKYERRCAEVISILSDSSLTMKSYYVDFNGKYHYYDKIISAELYCYTLFYSKYRDFYILRSDSLYKLDDSWTSICYYEIEEDSAFFAQKIIYAPTFMSLNTGGKIRDKNWLGEGISSELRNAKKNKKLHQKAQKRNVVYSDSTGGHMILRHIPRGGGGGFNTYSGVTPGGSSSAPLYSGSFNSYQGDNSNSSSYVYEIIIDSARIGIPPFTMYSIAEKDFATKRYKINHNKILEVLKPNQELFDLFVEEYQRSFDIALREEPLKKTNKAYRTISYHSIFQHIMDKYYSDYLVRFKVQN